MTSNLQGRRPPVLQFNIQPFIGALPVVFGMQRKRVHEILGKPESSHPIWNGSGLSEYWQDAGVVVGYNNEGVVNHLGFSPGRCELRFLDSLLWSPADQPDPNPTLLRQDRTPLEALGF